MTPPEAAGAAAAAPAGTGAESAPANGASGEPPVPPPEIESRPSRVALPGYFAEWRHEMISFQHRCTRCGRAQPTPPLFVYPCTAAALLERTGARSIAEAVDAHPRAAANVLREGRIACTSCALHLASGGAVQSPEAHALPEPGSSAGAELAAAPTAACTAPGCDHAKLVPCSRLDAYAAYVGYIANASDPRAWTEGEASGRALLASARDAGARLVAALPAAPPAPIAAPAPGPAPAPAPTHLGPRPRRHRRVVHSASKKGKRRAGSAHAPAPAAARAPSEERDELEDESEPENVTKDRPRRARTAAAAATESPSDSERNEDDPSAGPSSRPKRKRSKWSAPSDDRKPWRSDKLVRTLVAAYAVANDDDDDKDHDDAAADDASSAPRDGEPGSQEGASDGGDDSDDAWEVEQRRRWAQELGRLAEDERDVAAAAAAAAAAKGKAPAGSEASVDACSLDAMFRGMEGGVSPVLVGLGLDASAEARAELARYANDAGVGRLRAILLIACAVLGIYERFVARYSKSRRTWGLFRAINVDPRYDDALRSCGFRTDESTMKARTYLELRHLASTLRRFPGLARVTGAAHAHDFVNFVPLLLRVDAKGLEEVRQRLEDEVPEGMSIPDDLLAEAEAEGDGAEEEDGE
eukprot:tig00020539_g10398.t1